MNDLTDRQRQTLDFIVKHLDANGYPPSLQEIAGALRISGNLGVLRHLRALESKGYITRHAGARGIGLTAQAGRHRAVPVPVVGSVRAGLPALSEENIDRYCATDPSWLKGDGCFYLRVAGDSMVEAGILDGDLALIHPQAAAINRDVVVALVDGEATLKTFFREHNHIRLQPANASMPPIIIRPGDRDVTIVGKVIGVYRQME